MSYKAALFDMNGVIVDDEALNEAAFKTVLRARGFDLDHETYIQYFAGKTDKYGFGAFCQSRGEITLDLNEACHEKATEYMKLAQTSLKPYSGVVDYIKALQAEGYRLGLVTSSIQLEADTILRAFGLIDTFEVVITADQTTESKPSPQGYLRAAKALNLKPNECFVIEDAPSGVAASNSAGMDCLAVTNTHTREQLNAASLIVDKLNQTIVVP